MFYTSQAFGAFAGRADNCSILRAPECIIWASFKTYAAANAFLVPPAQLQSMPLRLRIGAPGAFKGATLHEDCVPNAWTVMDGELLDVEYASCQLFHVTPSRVRFWL